MNLSSITVSASQFQTFANVQTPSMVVNEVGHVVGMFYPVNSSPELCPFTKEELEKRAAEPGIYSTQEVLAELKRRFPE